jgi:hypothetical protein
VHKFGGVWHLYFTGRSTACPYTNATGLQSFWGIGLATSTVPPANIDSLAKKNER